MTPVARRALVLTCLPAFMVALDNLVVINALAVIRRDLHASIPALSWVVNAYILAFGVLMLTAATLGDRFGRRRAFIAGLIIFSVASAMAAVAPDVGVLIAARALQGAGAAAVMPLSLALLCDGFPPGARGAAIGIYGGVTGAAVAVGPLVGGAIVQGLSWQWIFWLNVPIGLLAAAAAPLVITPMAGAWADKIGNRVLIATGLALQAAGFAWLAVVLSPTSGYLTLLGPFLVAGIGIGLVFPAVANAVMSGRTLDETGLAAATNASFREIGGVFGVVAATTAFGHSGALTSAHAFTRGTVAALTVAAAFSALGAAGALRTSAKPSPAGETVQARADA